MVAINFSSVTDVDSGTIMSCEVEKAFSFYYYDKAEFTLVFF